MIKFTTGKTIIILASYILFTCFAEQFCANSLISQMVGKDDFTKSDPRSYKAVFMQLAQHGGGFCSMV